MNKKLFYTTPSSKVFEVRLENGPICGSFNDDGNENPGDGGDENFGN